MAEAGRQGRALRMYQIALVLAVGWVAGRLPSLIADNQHEKQSLQQALGLATPAAATTSDADRPLTAAETRLAADVAARVAVDVADRTIARLIEAGWGPQPAAPGHYAPWPASVAPPRRPAVAAAPASTAPAGEWQLPARAPQQLALAAGDGPGELRATQPPVEDSAAARAHATASEGYAALRNGDRRRAVALLDAAAREAPDAPDAQQWQADSRQLGKHWSLAGYVLSRKSLGQDALAASPVLGGAQMGAALGYTLDPLADVRVSVVGRVTAALGNGRGGIDRESTEAALGVRLQPWRDIPIAVDVERRIALGYYARNAWAARISGGGGTDFHTGGRPWRLEGYGEAGVIGIRNTAYYAGGQARVGTPLMDFGRVTLDAGAGVWGATQKDYGQVVSRLDVGPSAQFRIKPWPFHAQLDYRVKTAGNAYPGSGPVLVVAGEF